MEKGPQKTAENSQGNQPNFHEIAEKREELRQAIKELGINQDNLEENQETPEVIIFNKHYKKELEELNKEASVFKISDFESLSDAKEILKKQKLEHKEKIFKNRAQIDYETILKNDPEIGEVQKKMKEILYYKDFRMKRMFETLDPKISTTTKKRNEEILGTIKEKIIKNRNELEEVDQNVLHQAELVKYKENLSESGHICITPSVEKYLDVVGDRMLTGKPIFLHGPTGTGKTSLARFATTHFTGKDTEMVFCNPQTRESNVWGKTGIRPAKDGAIETVEIYGPLAKAMAEGRTVIFDEFTALPKEQMVFIKGVFNAKIGDMINIVGNGTVKIKPGFQMIFTANLKSEKNPERQDLPPEIAREFEQNNIKINYTPQDEAYDIILARLLNKDGTLDMSYFDLNTTLPSLCKAMAEIQESYTNETNKDLAKKVGAMEAGGKIHSLKKFVMTQGSVEAILSSWVVERQTKRTERSFSEFLDERFKTALTFEEYSKEDRILVAKILASKGFLLTLNAKDLELPEDIFKLNTIKAMRGEEAISELKKESGDVKHLTLKEVAELDPFNKRVELLRKKAENLLGNEDGEKDPFLENFNKRFRKTFGKEKNKNTEIEVTYKEETIILNFDQKLQEFKDLYQKTNVNLPPDFEENMQDIWEKNQREIKQAIEQNGFNEMLLIPATPDLPDLSEKMKMQNGYYTGSNFDAGGEFKGAKSQNVDKPRIVLAHKTQNLKDNPELAKTLNTLGKDVDQKNTLTLEDYLVFQRKYFEETSKHLDEVGVTWLATKSAAHLVRSGWGPDGGRLDVSALDLVSSYSDLGVRPSRSFFLI